MAGPYHSPSNVIFSSHLVLQVRQGAGQRGEELRLVGPAGSHHVVHQHHTIQPVVNALQSVCGGAAHVQILVTHQRRHLGGPAPGAQHAELMFAGLKFRV